jgi:hypothetical protein
MRFTARSLLVPKTLAITVLITMLFLGAWALMFAEEFLAEAWRSPEK